MTAAAPVALTFDDGPDPDGTPAVLDALARAGARATFFVIAPSAERSPQLLARIREEGHAVGLHCDRHVRHTDLDAAALEQDTATALDRLAALGVRPTLWRTPWGVTSDATAAVAAAHGLRLVHWTADTEDWAGHAPGAMVARVAADLAPGGIVLAHDGIGPGSRRTSAANTVAAVGPLVALARELGSPCEALGAEDRA